MDVILQESTTFEKGMSFENPILQIIALDWIYNILVVLNSLIVLAFAVAIEVIIIVFSYGTGSFLLSLLVLQLIGLPFFVALSIGFGLTIMNIDLKKYQWDKLELLEYEIRLTENKENKVTTYMQGELVEIELGTLRKRHKSGNRTVRNYHLKMVLHPRNSKPIILNSIYKSKDEQEVRTVQENITRFLTEHTAFTVSIIEDYDKQRRRKIALWSLLPAVLVIIISVLLILL